MASVFLSYAREDEKQAEALAQALVNAGHEVWWDRRVRGGTEFAGEIEAALASADNVLVLWSKSSIGSAWVRDEASEGREKGCLLPVLIEAVRPPLGFRQVQAIDLSRWRGRGPPPLGPLLEALERGKAVPPAPPVAARKWPAFALPVAAVAMLLLVAAGAWVAIDRWWAPDTPTPVIAVLPFTDLSPAKDKAYLAEGVGEAILSMLARQPGVSVIGRTSASQFRDKPGDLARMRKVLGVTHILEGSAQTSGDQLRMRVRLVDAVDGKQLWAENYQRPLSNIFAVQDEIARAVSDRLKVTVDGVLGGNAPSAVAVDNYTLYLAARAKMRLRKQQSLSEALELARQLTRSDPNYAAAYALQAEALWLLSDSLYGNFPRDRAARMAEPLALKAIRLAPDLADGHEALGGIRLFRDPAGAVEALNRALELDPSRSDVRLWLAIAYSGAGRNVEALREYQAAEAMDPLSPAVILSFVPAYSSGGRFEEARKLVDAYEKRGGLPREAVRLQAEIAFAQGDLVQAVRLINQALVNEKDTLRTRKRLAFMYSILGLHDRAARISLDMPEFTRLRMMGAEEELYRKVRALGPRIWQQPHVEIAFAVLARKRDWPAIASAFDANREFGEVLCNGLEMQITLPVIMALKALGRRDEASRFLRCQQQWLTKVARGPVGHSGFPQPFISGYMAMVMAIEGRGDQAFRLMNRAVDQGFRTPYGQGLTELPPFDAYRDSTNYSALHRRLKELVSRDRAKVERLGARAAS